MPDRNDSAAVTPRHAVSRRDFLGQAGRLAGGMLVLGAGGAGLLHASPAGAAPAALERRAFAAGRFALMLEGLPPVFLRSFEGGTARGEVVEVQLGADRAVKKHLAGNRFDPIALRANLGAASQPLIDQVQKLLTGIDPRLNGAIVVADANFKALRRLEFTNAQIGEVVFPALDGASKEAAFVDVMLVPEQARWSAAKGEPISQEKVLATKGALLSNFELAIDGVDCTRVQRIEPLTIKSTQTTNEVGEMREILKEPGRLEIPNLVVMLPEAFATGFRDWHQTFVIDGKNRDDLEKSGTLKFLDAARKEALLTLGFDHLGIFALTQDAEANSDKGSRLKAEMYCEAMKVSVKA
jgi:hypothetical protein